MVKIHKAGCQDGQEISKLLKDKYSFSSVAEALETFNGECTYQHYRIAEEAEKIVGLISWRPQGIFKHGVVELSRIAVSPYVNDTLTVKELLFDVMVAEADYFYKQHGSKLRKIYSMIHADNREIKDFFINKGMLQEAVLRNHYHRGTDELVFSLFFG